MVTSVEVNKDTLASGVQPLDLITHFDGKLRAWATLLDVAIYLAQ